MRNILLALLISFTALSQNHTIQIELINNDVGSVINSSPTYASCGTSSNDSGLNVIFESHNVGSYCSWAFTSYPEMLEVGGGLIDCYGCDPTALISDLEEYGTVISRARLTPGPELFANYIHVNITETISQTGTTPENIVITSNPILNEIFADYTVFEFQNVVGNWYSITCDCYSPDLVSALVSQSIVLPDDFEYDHIYYLSNQAFELDKIIAYPNPFRENLQISSNSLGAAFHLFDLSGKIIIRTTSPDDLRTSAYNITPGMYLLKIVHDTNSKTIKLVKQ